MNNASRIAAAVFCAALATGAFAQAPNDTPRFKLGATIFADYTWLQSPETTDTDGNRIHPGSFNVSRTYINFTGKLNHRISFRVTPDIKLETGNGSGLNGSYTLRLKYGFAQFDLDDWTTHGSWLRFGQQQTPFVDYAEGVYRYRFQGPIFVDREGYLSSSDPGFSGHYNLPGNYGDIHAGVYNGEGYGHTEANNEKAFQIRGSLRPLPLAGIWKGLRLTAFVDDDHYAHGDKRTRYIGEVSFESSRLNAAVDYLSATDQKTAVAVTADATGYSAWITPKFGGGWEALLRHDEIKPDKRVSLKRKHDIAGIAYWFQHLQGVQSALMLDYDSYKQSGVTPVPPKTTAYGIKMLINF